MRRLFWLGLGVAAGVAASRKTRETVHKSTPAGIAGNLGEAVHELAGALGAFGADVRAGMAEREGQLQDSVQERTGIDSAGSAVGAGPRHAGTARARRAGD